MNDNHILDILDAGLNQANTALIESHAAHCANCRRAVEAARVSGALWRAKTIEPSPFFQAKILNALRERQNLAKPLAAFWRWWHASAALVALMIVTVAALATLTFLAPQTDASSESQASIANYNFYSTEAVILNQKTARDLTNEQTLQIIYDGKSDSDENK